MTVAEQAEQHRTNVAQLALVARNDLQSLLGPLTGPEAVRDALLYALPGLVEFYGSASATLAADWYDDLRASLGVPGRFTAAPASLPDTGRSEALARWAVDPMFKAEAATEALRTAMVPMVDLSARQASTLADGSDRTKTLERTAGGLQRIIANASRETIAGSSIEDPRAEGWQRTGNGACGFCAMLISRGTVYTKHTADFASHDHCNCSAAPAWSGQPRPVRPYTPSPRKVRPADRARVREYLATH